MSQEQPVPVQPAVYTPEQRALIAGYLLWTRAGVLRALETMTSSIVDRYPQWSGPTRDYYVAAEAFSRYQLWAIGYPVAQNDTWGPDASITNP